MRKNYIKNYFLKPSRGMASLPAVLALAVLIVTVSVSIVAVTYSENVVTVVLGESERAMQYAEVGVQDALIRITKDKTYSCDSEDCYSLPLVSGGCDNAIPGCAYVRVDAGSGTSETPKVITSKGKVKNITRTVRVQVEYDAASYGKISTTTWSEVE